MSRAPNEPVIIRPSNNVYTALAVLGFVAALIGLIVLFVRAAQVFPGGLLGG